MLGLTSVGVRAAITTSIVFPGGTTRSRGKSAQQNIGTDLLCDIPAKGSLGRNSVVPELVITNDKCAGWPGTRNGSRDINLVLIPADKAIATLTWLSNRDKCLPSSFGAFSISAFDRELVRRLLIRESADKTVLGWSTNSVSAFPSIVGGSSCWASFSGNLN